MIYGFFIGIIVGITLTHDDKSDCQLDRLIFPLFMISPKRWSSTSSKKKDFTWTKFAPI